VASTCTLLTGTGCFLRHYGRGNSKAAAKRTGAEGHKWPWLNGADYSGKYTGVGKPAEAV